MAYLATKRLLAILISMLYQCERLIVATQLVTAGSYYRDISENINGSGNATDESNVAIVLEEMFRCSREVGCGHLGKQSNRKELKDISNNVDLAKMDEVLEKKQSGFKNCKELSGWGVTASGKVDISWKNGSAFLGYCNMVKDGGDWLVFQRRVDTTNFFRNWTEYVAGFGDRDGSFWLGLEALHWLTYEKGNVTMRIDVRDTLGNEGFAKYNNFKVESAEQKYKITFDEYQGNIGDSLRRSRGMRFSTPDNDNDLHPNINCAERYHGPWWLSNCFDGNLNNEHPYSVPAVSTPEAEGAALMSWYGWKEEYGTIVFSEMMLKSNP